MSGTLSGPQQCLTTNQWVRARGRLDMPPVHACLLERLLSTESDSGVRITLWPGSNIGLTGPCRWLHPEATHIQPLHTVVHLLHGLGMGPNTAGLGCGVAKQQHEIAHGSLGSPALSSPPHFPSPSLRPWKC